MSAPAADRNLLFGILALQMDFITRDQLVAGMHAWVLDKKKPLGQILCDQRALTADTHALLDALVQKHLAMHGNDAQKSLAALSSVGSARKDLEQVPDPDLRASLVQVGASRAADDDPFATASAGVATSTGLRFRIVRPHAEGGLGKVFVAHDEELHREVALKEIKDRYADKPESRSRFLLEAEITGGLEHPGIVPVYGLGQYADGRPFYAMRFIRGDSLKDAIENYHKPQGEVLRTLGVNSSSLQMRKLLGRFIDVCNAMQYAHDRGVLHRDLKPGNIMLGKYGETLVVDWGLAKPHSKHNQPGAPATGASRSHAGLRTRPAPEIRQWQRRNASRFRHRHPRLHEPRTSRRPTGLARPRQRRLEPGSHPLLAPHRPRTLRKTGRARDAEKGPARRFPPPAPARTRRRPRPRSDLPESHVPQRGRSLPVAEDAGRRRRTLARYLNSCRPDFRGREHDYLYTLFKKPQQTLKGHTNSIASVAFSPDGKRIVSGSWDKTLKVWDASSGQETLTLKGHTESVTSVAFSPDGKKIVSGSADFTLKVWDASLSMDPRPRAAALEAGRENANGKEK